MNILDVLDIFYGCKNVRLGVNGKRAYSISFKLFTSHRLPLCLSIMIFMGLFRVISRVQTLQYESGPAYNA